MTAAVSRAGGSVPSDADHCAGRGPRARHRARKETNKPFGMNFLLFDVREDSFAEALQIRPAVMQFAWARQDQDLKPILIGRTRLAARSPIWRAP